MVRIGLLDQMRKDLGIGFTPKVMALRREFFAQLGKILDDAIVDHRDFAIAAHVWMSVFHRGAPMRRPTCVTDSAGRSRMTGDQLVFEACHLAHAANHINRARRLPRRAKLERDASRVVAPVLKALEARDQHVDGGLGSGISNNSAHGKPFRSIDGSPRVYGRIVTSW